MMIHIGERYMLDEAIEVIAIKSFKRSLSRILIQLPDKVLMLVEHKRLKPLLSQNHTTHSLKYNTIKLWS